MLKGHLDMIVLAALSAAGSAHGYAVIEEIKRRSGGAFDLPEGTIYPALHRLEQAGLLKSSWMTADSAASTIMSRCPLSISPSIPWITRLWRRSGQAARPRIQSRAAREFALGKPNLFAARHENLPVDAESALGRFEDLDE